MSGALQGRKGLSVKGKPALTVDISLDQWVAALRRMKKSERERWIEDFLASLSPDYLESIQEAREDYRAGRIKTHSEVFGQSL